MGIASRLVVIGISCFRKIFTDAVRINYFYYDGEILCEEKETVEPPDVTVYILFYSYFREGIFREHVLCECPVNGKKNSFDLYKLFPIGCDHADLYERKESWSLQDAHIIYI